MGAPLWLSKAAQAATGAGHLGTFLEILKNYEFEEDRGNTRIRKEAWVFVVLLRRGIGLLIR